MTVFFSVDVETSALNPQQGDLLTFGVVAVQHHPMDGWQATDKLYVRINHEYDGDVNICWDPDTEAWWEKQDAVVQREIFDYDLVRHDIDTAAAMLREFVLDVGYPDDEEGNASHGNVFVAHPVSFDKMWIDNLFGYSGVKNPFSYRSLDLRSLAYGKHVQRQQSEGFGAEPWDAFRPRIHKPVQPHHALSDAMAQALDLMELL